LGVVLSEKAAIMAWKMILCAVCDECGHAWLTDGNPYRCAKCKSSLWNRKVVMPNDSMEHKSLGNAVPGVAASGQTRKRRDIW
jgi:tRNA(Ile2) C34 agmatinyltransferase TiaS